MMALEQIVPDFPHPSPEYARWLLTQPRPAPYIIKRSGTRIEAEQIVVHCGEVIEAHHDSVCPTCGEWVDPTVRHTD